MARITFNINIMTMIVGLIFAVFVASNLAETFDSSNESFTDDKSTQTDESMINNVENEMPPLTDQINLLSKQFKLLNEKRQDEYRMLERSLHSFVEKHLQEYINVDVKKELKDLR